jgi:PAS domain S-box-containing protein
MSQSNRIPKIAVILTDADRRILWVNEDFTSITGYTLGEVQGKKPSILQGPKSEKDVITRIRKGLENKVSLKDEITNYRKNGEEYLCRLVIHPIFNKEQQLINFIAFEVDGDQVEDDSPIPLLKLEEKYSSSSLKGIDELKLFARLKELMEEKSLYLNPNLTLKEVSDRLGTNTKYLSQVVNHHGGHNFQHFLNTYRIKEVQRKIGSNACRNHTLYGIARKCGFKNKSTFYKVFKEITGMTPKAFVVKEKTKGV